jgi:hypothetical protein
MAAKKPDRYVQARFQQSMFEQHRRNAEIGNGGRASGSGGTAASDQEPRERGEGFGEAGRRGKERASDRAREHAADNAMHSRRPRGDTENTDSGMERAMHKHADKLHPVKR